MTQSDNTGRWLEIVEESQQLKRQIRRAQNHFIVSVDRDSTMMNKLRYRSQQLPPVSTDLARLKTPSSAERTEKKKSKRRSLQIELGMDRLRSGDVRTPKFSAGDEDKENAVVLQVDRLKHRDRSWSVAKSLAKLDTKTQVQARPRDEKTKLTPIKEENLDQSSMNVIRCIPKNFLTPRSSRKSLSKEHSKRSKRRSGSLVLPAKTTDLQEVATKLEALKKNVLASPRALSNDVSLGFAGRIGGVIVELSNFDCTEPSTDSGRRTLSSASHLSLSLECHSQKAIQDISQISSISNRVIPQEQASSANLSGAFHSTFQYPLHSTFNYPLHSSMNLSNLPKIPEEPLKYAVSERGTKRKRESTSMASLTKKPDAKRCREHGLHPAFGNQPCIFKKDDTFTFDDSASEIDVDVTLSAQGFAAASRWSQSECDSSCLSICVDENSLTEDWGETKRGSPTFDSNNQTRMLKRQTAKPELNQRHTPIGLSESDLQADMTQENMSLMVTRATLPNLSDLSDEESTLHASPAKRRRTRNLTGDSIPLPNFTLIGFEKTPDKSHRRQSSRRSSQHHRQNSSRPRCPVSEQITAVASPMTSVSPFTNTNSFSSAHLDQHSTSRGRTPSRTGTINDNTGRTRRITQHAPVSGTLSRERKRALARQLREFSSSFRQDGDGATAQEIETLGHF